MLDVSPNILNKLDLRIVYRNLHVKIGDRFTDTGTIDPGIGPGQNIYNIHTLWGHASLWLIHIFELS